jgi:hypothetical protein
MTHPTGLALLLISFMTGGIQLLCYPADIRFSKRGIVHVGNDPDRRLLLQEFRERLLLALLRVSFEVVKVIETDDGTVHQIGLDKIKYLDCRIV